MEYLKKQFFNYFISSKNTVPSSGITLISLIVTIIVLLILAGISISAALGDNGILTKAFEAKDLTIQSEEKEQVSLAYIAAKVKKSGNNIVAEDLQNELDKTIPGKTVVTTISDGIFEVYFKETGHYYRVEDGVVTFLENGTGGTIPDKPDPGEPDPDEPVPEGMVARIDTTYYPSLQKAIDAVPTNNSQTTVVLLVDTVENVTVSENQNIVLDLNEHTIENAEQKSTVTISGTTTIKNGTINGNFTYTLSTISIKENGALTINDGIFNSTRNTISNLGTLNMGGTAELNSSAEIDWPTLVVNEGSTANITGGTINAEHDCAIFTARKLKYKWLFNI